MISQERRRALFLPAFLAAAILACPGPGPAGARARGAWLTAPDVPQTAAIPAPGEIEKELLRVLNAEREARGLPALRLSAPLAGLARAQSAEMARLGVLSHESSAGRTLTDRLARAGVAFAANAENVARSGTYLAKVIHESFMASPGHRENVLNPLFDEAGIGIVAAADGSYYVTEDFVRALVEKPAAEVRAFILGVLDEARTAAGRVPVVLLDDADRTAQRMADERAAGRPLPQVPAYFGETLVRVASGPDLDMIAGRLRGRDLAGYGRAGIGVRFGRGPEFPGGAYFVCALLIRDGAGPGPDDLERLLTVLAAANGIRAKKKLPLLELDAGLSERADAVIARKRAGEKEEGPDGPGKDVFFAMFQKLDQVAPELRKRLEDPGLRRIGISTLPVQTSRDIPIGHAVAVVLAR